MRSLVVSGGFLFHIVLINYDGSAQGLAACSRSTRSFIVQLKITL